MAPLQMIRLWGAIFTILALGLAGCLAGYDPDRHPWGVAHDLPPGRRALIFVCYWTQWLLFGLWLLMWLLDWDVAIYRRLIEQLLAGAR